MDLVFGDFNSDGLLDIVYANSDAPITIHYGDGSKMSEQASWISDDVDSLNSITTGDFNSDGFPDLAVTSNTSYLSSSRLELMSFGTGATKIYFNTGTELERSPSWTSLVDVNAEKTSSIAGADIDGDGDIDLAVGGWWEGSRIYINEDGILNRSIDWSSGSLYDSVAEAMQFGDIDNDGLTAVYDEIKNANSGKKLFYLNHSPVREIIDIFVDGKMLDSSNYILNPELGFFTLQDNLYYGDVEISISYLYSRDLDLLVSNWDPDKGNYIFLNNFDDISPPYIISHQPNRESEDVSIDSTVSFKVLDSKSGVDFNSILIESNLEGKFEIEGISNGFFIEYTGQLEYNKDVLIEISASDIASNPNVMRKHSFRFKTAKESDFNPPVILWGGFF